MEIRTVTKIEKPVPPSELTQPCERPGSSDFNVLSDVLNDRQDWITAWERCNARYNSLIQWVGRR
ncbi:Rz1-like lysis system protein LysC [Methylovorus glucosotrophus]|uniref:Rz1-like lysis system protein LysC n=1 Tax=Methylovorus glucosotrophus TaxID=266009 RepID=UPI003F89AAFD